MAFQIIDDIMDFTLEKKVTGKSLGDDFKSGKTTLPIKLKQQVRKPNQPEVLDVSGIGITTSIS